MSEASDDRPGLEVPPAEEDARTLQHLDRSVDVSLRERDAREPRQRLGEREGMVRAFRDPECGLGMRPRVDESPDTRQGQGEPRVRPRLEERRERDALLICSRRTPGQQIEGTAVVADREVRLSGAVLGLELERTVALCPAWRRYRAALSHASAPSAWRARGSTSSLG